jgi:hypothetical protein
MIKKYVLYLLRWQLSTPILAGVLWLLAGVPVIWATVIANLVGGLVFFWVDRWIFKGGEKDAGISGEADEPGRGAEEGRDEQHQDGEGGV